MRASQTLNDKAGKNAFVVTAKQEGVAGNAIGSNAKMRKSWFFDLGDRHWQRWEEFLDLKGYYLTAVLLNLQLVDSWRPRDDLLKESLSSTLMLLGGAHNSLGHFPGAIQYHQRSLNLARELGNRSEEGYALGKKN